MDKSDNISARLAENAGELWEIIITNGLSQAARDYAVLKTIEKKRRGILGFLYGRSLAKTEAAMDKLVQRCSFNAHRCSQGR